MALLLHQQPSTKTTAVFTAHRQLNLVANKTWIDVRSDGVMCGQ